MNKPGILKTLNQTCNNSSVKLPEPLGFYITENCLTIEIPEEHTNKNMQDDNSAFEAWAIVLKRWIKDLKTVVIKWEEPILDENSNEMQHYHFIST